ncbi:RagB/SusD family nutrient uptake outer membrane protein [Flavobacterium fluviatile]|uniref:RagB/SusD family nutrient uptake outer membrane protein n=1 Tax=Flavobacterium fluviatile TaxID=1862387 RepID=UPI0013D62F80|nr:RagB/SusD family nutrient uptake outer membrane protein [Flavobacterium fluviatile]
MKRFIYKYTSIVLAVGFLNSCSPDLTETNPNYTDSSNYWNNLTETNKGLTSAYATLLSQFVLNMREEAVRSDMGWYSTVRPTPFPTTDLGYTFWYQTYGNDNQFIERHWAACYRGTFRANQVIEALEKIKASSDNEKWTQQMAEARFLRGLFHFYLHTSFNKGRIIIDDHTPVTNEDFFRSTSSSDAVLAFFRADLKYAYDNLPPTRTPEELGRATKGAAATLLGTSYLYQEEYEAAKVYLNDVITNSAYKYSLVTDMSKLFTTAGEFNAESIFEINFDAKLRPDLGQFDEEILTTRAAFLCFSQNLCVTPPAWVAYAYKTEPMDPKDSRNHLVPTNLTSPLRNVPLRASAMITLPEDLQTPVYLAPNVLEANPALPMGAVNATASIRIFGFYKKYTNHDLYTGEGANPDGAQKSSKNITLNRLAEVYLMQAECYAKTGNVQGALDLINKVRARWGLVLYGTSGEYGSARTYDGIAYTADMVMNKLMYVDRPLELSLEGHALRFTDLRRWGIVKSNFERLATDNYYAEDYKFVNSKGTTITKYRISVVKTPGTMPSSLVPNEFAIPAQNFVEGVSEYLPIPSNEVARNPNLTK